MTTDPAAEPAVDQALAGHLAGLGAAAPPGLDERVVARWVEVGGPVGPLFVAFTEVGVARVAPAEATGGDPEPFLEAFRARFGRPLRREERPPPELADALRTGRGGGLRYDLRGLGSFDRAVLAKTLEIPPGEVRPYAWVARQVGRPAAVRAAGSALGRNPVPVLIPCHRVVRSDGATGDYAFGAPLKRRLLEAESVELEEGRRLARRGFRYLARPDSGIYCYPTCTRVRADGGGERVGVSGPAAAAAAGLHPCARCRPPGPAGGPG